MSIFRTISTKEKPSLRRQHWNGDLPVEEEPGKSVPGQGEGNVPKARKSLAWPRNRHEVSPCWALVGDKERRAVCS